VTGQHPLRPDLRRRVELTVAVPDTAGIPKVEGAGEIRTVDGKRVQVMHNGLLVEEGAYQGAWQTEVIQRLRGHHEPQEEAVFHAIVERLAAEEADEPRVMMELGAWWAYYSMWFARRLPAARTVLVEPDPGNLEVGRRHYALNDLEGIFVQAAVGGEHGGRMWLRSDTDNLVRQVPTVTIEGVLDEHGLGRLDLLLCDAQGAETSVLTGAQDLLRSGRIRFAIVSTHHHSISGDPLTHQRCLELVHSAGGHVIAEHTVSESCSGDGLIAASFDVRDADFHVAVSHVRARDSLFGEPEYDLAAAWRWDASLRWHGGRLIARLRDRKARGHDRSTAPGA
jgi:FkbM family methyltransferase